MLMLQLPSSNHLCVLKILEEEHSFLRENIYDAVCRKAPVKPGLLNIHTHLVSCLISKILEEKYYLMTELLTVYKPGPT